MFAGHILEALLHGDPKPLLGVGLGSVLQGAKNALNGVVKDHDPVHEVEKTLIPSPSPRPKQARGKERAMRDVYARLGRSVVFQSALIALIVAMLGVPQAAAAQKQAEGIYREPVKHSQPGCEITGIDATTGVVTAKINSTGKTFRFRAKNPQTLRSFRVGQTVSLGKGRGSSHSGPKILDPTDVDEGDSLYINGVYVGDVVGAYGGIYGEGPSGPVGPGPNPGGPSPGCTACRNDAVQQLLACKNNANQKYQPGSSQWASAIQSCQQTYNNAVPQCGCGDSGPAGSGGSACTTCTNTASQQFIACVRTANQQFQQHKSSAAAAQLQSDLAACDANYEKAINRCPCH